MLADAIANYELSNCRLSEGETRTGKFPEELNIAASASAVYYKVKIAVQKLPLVAFPGSAPTGPIVVDINASRLGKTKSGFVPKVALRKGITSLQEIKGKGELFCTAWVGDKALKKLNIHPDDVLGTNYSSQLSQDGRWVVEVNASNVLYEKDGNFFRQPYSKDNGKVELVGSAQVENVHRKELPEDLNELQTMVNVQEALKMYLKACRHGEHVPAVHTDLVPEKWWDNAEREVLIASAEANVKVDTMDFLLWQHKELSAAVKKKAGLSREDFAYVGDKNDPSTWKLKIQDAKHVRLALARINQTQGIPESAKAGVLKKIRERATKLGIDVSEKPTSGQKKWARAAEGIPL